MVAPAAAIKQRQSGALLVHDEIDRRLTESCARRVRRHAVGGLQDIRRMLHEQREA